MAAHLDEFMKHNEGFSVQKMNLRSSFAKLNAQVRLQLFSSCATADRVAFCEILKWLLALRLPL